AIVPLPFSRPVLVTPPRTAPLLVIVPALVTLPRIMPVLVTVPVLATPPKMTPLLVTVPALPGLPPIVLALPLFRTPGWATVTWVAARPALTETVPCWRERLP